jgi:hypothetical protein
VLSRRFLIALLALAQCFAPLLHAHAGIGGHAVVEHGGWHLPELIPQDLNGHTGPVCEDADHVPSEAVFCLGSSLGTRQIGLPGGNLPCLAHLSASETRCALPWAPHPFLDGPPPLLTSRRTPLPCAPPRG